MGIGRVGAACQMDEYTIPETGTSVDFPASIFTEDAGKPDGRGQRFRTSDGRADLTIQAAPNVASDSPAEFLAKKHPPSRIQYTRVTSRFFAVSSYRGNKVFYDRCNFSGHLVHCVLINYPASEERAWDGHRHPHKPVAARQVASRPHLQERLAGAIALILELGRA